MSLFVILLFFIISGCGSGERPFYEVSLDGVWSLALGDSTAYSRPDFDDTKWRKIKAGHSLNDLGYPSYDGFVWYRYKVIIPSSIKKDRDIKKLQFFLGTINDIDEVYLNGSVIGSNGINQDSTFNRTVSQSHLTRKYEINISDHLIKWDRENVLAIRIFDFNGDGGMKSIPHLVTSKERFADLYQLPRAWKIILGDSLVYAQTNFNDQKWANIQIGNSWERQGFANYDGISWYRTSFDLSLSLKKQAVQKSADLQFWLGQIDDNDQVFINGRLIGENNCDTTTNAITNDFLKLKTLATTPRVYNLQVNDKALNWGDKNVIAVRVADKGGDGGLYDMPYIKLATSNDNIFVDRSKLFMVNSNNLLDTVFTVFNKGLKSTFNGVLTYTALDIVSKKVLVDEERPIKIGAKEKLIVPVSLPYTINKVLITIRVVSKDENVFLDSFFVPFVLK